jgi:hypothetical protein
MAILSAGLLFVSLGLVAPRAMALNAPALSWDLNGDGYAELAVGAWGERVRVSASTMLVEVGRVTVFPGTPNGPTTQGIRKISSWVTPGEFAYFGRALTSCDFDADGYADMAIGAPGGGNPGETTSRGTVSILYGSSTGPVDEGRQLLRPGPFGRGGNGWGSPLACGDLNDDGFADLVIGGFSTWDQTQLVTVIYGSSAGLDLDEYVHLDELHAVGGDPDDVRGGFGASLSIGDLDGDGTDDLVVGANAGGPFAGVFLFDGRADGVAVEASTVLRPDSPTLTRLPNSDWQGLGTSTAIGDFNGDGDGDLAIGGGQRLTGCDRDDTDYPCPGVVAVIPSASTGLILGSVRFWHPGRPGVAGRTQPTADSFGAVLAAGKLNGDSRDDLAIGAPAKNVGTAVSSGGVTILYGSTSGLTATNSQIWVQSTPGVPGIDEPADRFGSDLLISALRGASRTGLSIGVGGEDVGQVRDAGAVTVLLANNSRLSSAGSKTWSENSPGVPGLAVEQDFFASLRGAES